MQRMVRLAEFCTLWQYCKLSRQICSKTWIKGRVYPPHAVSEKHITTDLALRATRQAAPSLGRFVATMVMTERHLWLSLSGIKECDKAVLVDAPDLPSGLFGTSVEVKVDRFREARTQSATFGKFNPHRVQAPPKSSEPSPGTSS